MRRAMLTPLALLFGLATSAEADGGETTLAVAAGVEASSARFPSDAPPATDVRVAPLVVTRGSAKHDVTNWLGLTAGVESALAANVETSTVASSGATGTVLTGTMVALRAPLGVTAALDLGLPASATVTVGGGPTLTLWLANALVDPARRDADGRLVRLPVDIPDTPSVGGFVELRAAVGLRAFDSLALAVEPFVSASWSAGPAFAVGVLVEPRWITAIGPL